MQKQVPYFGSLQDERIAGIAKALVFLASELTQQKT